MPTKLPTDTRSEMTMEQLRSTTNPCFHFTVAIISFGQEHCQKSDIRFSPLALQRKPRLQRNTREVELMAKPKRKKPRYQIQEEQKSRIPANLSAQAKNNSWSPPLFYVDRHFRYVDCGNEEVWTAKQQQWWYEVAKGSIYSTANRCQECRSKTLAQHGGTPRRSHQERHVDDSGSSKPDPLL